MALWFPLMVNDRRIGEMQAVRRKEPMNAAGEYTYDWDVVGYSGLGGKAGLGATGTLQHRYDDGAFELVRKVMVAFEKKAKGL